MIFQRLFALFSFLKVASLCLGAVYFIFWFFVFFNAPIAETLAQVLDIPLGIVNVFFDTRFITAKGQVNELGYIAIGLFLGVSSWFFAALEYLTVKLERRVELIQIARARDEEARMNADLQKEYADSIMEYNYFSVYLRYKIRYANEIIAQNNSLTIADVVERSYAETSALIHKNAPKLGVRRNRASIFIRGIGYKEFDQNLAAILNAIKEVKLRNGKDAMLTEFLIVVDAQKTEEESAKSYQTAMQIAQMGYINKAIATFCFKTRFDLFQANSMFVTEVLGVSISNDTEDNDTLYLLKTKSHV